MYLDKDEKEKESSRHMWENNAQEENAIRVCSFCGKSQNQVNRLTLGSGDMNICDECVDLYREHIEKEAEKPATMEKLVQVCNSCGTRPPASHRYCYNCGTQLRG